MKLNCNIIKYLLALGLGTMFVLWGCRERYAHELELQKNIMEFLEQGDFNTISPYLNDTLDSEACIACIEVAFSSKKENPKTSLRKLERLDLSMDSPSIFFSIGKDTVKFIRHHKSNKLSIKSQDIIKLLKGENMLLKQIGDCLIDKHYFLEALTWYQAISGEFNDIIDSEPFMNQQELIKAAEQGNSLAMAIYGNQILNSIKTSIWFGDAELLEDTTHVFLLREAYLNGRLECARFLADIYENGIGVKADTSKAISWYFKGLPLAENRVVLPLVSLLSSYTPNKTTVEVIEILKQRLHYLSSYDSILWRTISVNFRLGKYGFPIDECLEICALEKAYFLGNKDVLPELTRKRKNVPECEYNEGCGMFDFIKNI